MGGLFSVWCNTQMPRGKSVDSYIFMPHEEKPKRNLVENKQATSDTFKMMLEKAKANSLKKTDK